jgi:hypothetical protein
MTFWKRYLIFTGALLLATGLWIAFLKNTPAFALFVKSVETVFWIGGVIPEDVMNFRGFIYSFSGTFLSLWGVFIIFISKNALIAGNKWAWNSLVYSTLLWFIIMMPSSVYYKVYYNAIGDVIFLIFLGIPLIKIKKYIFIK